MNAIQKNSTMKKNQYLCIAVLLAMTACSGNDEIQYDPASEPLLKLTATQSHSANGLLEQTRVEVGSLYTSTTGFDGGEYVRVYFNNASESYQVGAADPSSYLSVLSEGSLRYPFANVGETPLYAVYPAASAEAGIHTVAYDQTSDANYKASDLMFAMKNVDLTDKTVTQNLDFFHQLIRLKIVLTKGEELGNITKLELKNVKRAVSITPSDIALTQGSVSSAADDNDDGILVFSGSVDDTDPHTFYAVFPAQEWNTTPFLELTADGQPITYTLKKSDWINGYEYTLALDVDKLPESVMLEANITLTDWEDVDIESASRVVRK